MDINTLLRLLYHYLSIYWPEQLDQSLKPKDSAGCLECRNFKFDFIIVGAGSSGCVLANRLSANPKWKVLLIEAGGDEDYITDTPALADQLSGRNYDWNYTTTPQSTVCAGNTTLVHKFGSGHLFICNEGRCPFRRGRVMGGTSTINQMLYDRGHPTIYDQWEAMGNPGWNYKSVLYYFKKSENMTIPEFAQDTVYHSTSGPLPIAYPPSRTKLAIDYYNAAVYELGLGSADLNGAKHIGAHYIQANIKGATRCSASKAFLDPIKNRTNLYIFKNTLAIKVLFNGVGKKRAIGVTCVTNGEQYQVYANKEVILAAGAIETPKLLMLSGVGPKQHLEQLGISLVMDLPVGQQLIDIPLVTADFEANTKELQYNTERWKNAIKEYARYQSGLLSAPVWLAYAFLNASDATAKNTIATSEYTASYVLPPLSTDYTDKAVLRNNFILISPASKGTVTLKSANYNEPPLIDPNYLSEIGDIEIANKSLDIIQQYYSLTKTLNKYSPKFITPPECGEYPGSFTMEYTKCYIKYKTKVEGLNPCCSAKMGPAAKTSVVDSQLKVHNIDCLRVADASIIPIPPMADLFAPELMIGEKASDIIGNSYM